MYTGLSWATCQLSYTANFTLLYSFKKNLIPASTHIIINTDGKEETGKSRMVMGHWVTDICYNCNDLDSALKLKRTRLLSHSVKPVSSFRRHAHCIVGKARDLPDLKINATSQWVFLRLLTTRACGRIAGLADSLANRDKGLSVFNFICSSCI